MTLGNIMLSKMTESKMTKHKMMESKTTLGYKTVSKWHLGKWHLDKWHRSLSGKTIEIDRTRASTLCCFSLFFSSFEHVKTCWLLDPTTLKTHRKVWFYHIWLWIILSDLAFIVKTPILIKKLFLCFESKPRVGPINSQHINFKWGNIFAGICTRSSLISMGKTARWCRGDIRPSAIDQNSNCNQLNDNSNMILGNMTEGNIMLSKMIESKMMWKKLLLVKWQLAKWQLAK